MKRDLQFQEDNLPYSRSTYLVDTPGPLPTSMSFEGHLVTPAGYTPGAATQNSAVEDPMSLYSVVHKNKKSNGNVRPPIENGHSASSDSPCSIEQNLCNHSPNYEDTESEYASELRRQTYLQKIGKTVRLLHILYERGC